MSATNGLTGGLRKRSRLIGLALVAALALSAAVASSASAITHPIKATYMALGDSLAFGYSQQLFDENIPLGEPAAAFEHGYVNDYWAAHLKQAVGVQIQNLGCPGETSGSLIGNGALEAGLKAGQEAKEGHAVEPFGEAPCYYHEGQAEALGFPSGFKFPLHQEYLGPGVSQLETALTLIAKDAAEGHGVTTLTLNIGANDQLHYVKKCEQEVGEKVAKGEIPPSEAEKAFHLCLVDGAAGLGQKIGENIGRILTVIRDGSAFGGVNYEGKIVFVGAYNPYGNVLAYPTRKEQSEGKNDELLEGSNTLAKQFNNGFQGVATSFGACTANTLLRFNPENGLEPKHLQAWTNMTNTSESNGHKNGPDIHPTPEGYNQMSKYMINICK
jgi:lysophospholipase L1-like esterase